MIYSICPEFEAGKLTIETIRLIPDISCTKVFRFLRHLHGRREIEVQTLIEEGLSKRLYGDPARVHQVLLNLVGNALKFTEKGKITIQLTIQSEDDQTVIVKYSVTDTGIGLTESDRDCLFAPFYQVDSTTKRKHGGAGLGLNISKRLVELMHGEIGVESEKGVGSTFWFTVPFSRKSDKKESGEYQTFGLDARLQATKKSVLVVEDSPLLQTMTLRQLQSLVESKSGTRWASLSG